MNLRTIPTWPNFGLPVGLSDIPGLAAAVAAVALGADSGKNFCLSRSIPNRMRRFRWNRRIPRCGMISGGGKAMGSVQYVVRREEGSAVFRRSLFVVADMQAGDEFTAENLRSIRPGYGLAPRHYDEVIGHRAAAGIARGTPLAWPLVR